MVIHRPFILTAQDVTPRCRRALNGGRGVATRHAHWRLGGRLREWRVVEFAACAAALQRGITGWPCLLQE
jgi:hypothetical protein